MAVKYTKTYLEKIELLFSETTYHLRYEKGSFKSGYCILKNNKVIIVNKYFTLEGKINALLDILKELQLNPMSFENKKAQEFLTELQQTELKL
ncbi:hypothetical protein [Lunatibacter salilacus]|uniref:hypothetical protein n=1 Tax=Lunatibacter salilacus TaxID=2483804 RepID=UPI00131E7358|nr:hypothetical protein [Lunatibacter salilacus]